MKDQTGIDWVDGKKLSDLDFADDIALLRSSWEGMQTMTTALDEEADKIGLIITVAKAKITPKGDWPSKTTIKVGMEEIEKCEEFCYQESIISKDGGCDREIMIRLGKANVRLGGWGEPGEACRSISTSVKVRL